MAAGTSFTGHGLKDLWQHRRQYVANTRWWPPFCLVVDWVLVMGFREVQVGDEIRVEVADGEQLPTRIRINSCTASAGRPGPSVELACGAEQSGPGLGEPWDAVPAKSDRPESRS
jgi:hypothetical protein